MSGDYNRGGYNGGRGYGGRGSGYDRGNFQGGRGSGLTYAERQALRRLTVQQEVERTLMLQRVLAGGAQDPAVIMALMSNNQGGTNDALLMATMMQQRNGPVTAGQGCQQNQDANRDATVSQVVESVRDLTSLVSGLRAEVAALRASQIELSPRPPFVPNFAPQPHFGQQPLVAETKVKPWWHLKIHI